MKADGGRGAGGGGGLKPLLRRGGGQGSAGAVAEAELKAPVDGPCFCLLVLADFDEDGIRTFFQVDGQGVLVETRASVVFIAAEEECAIEPDLPGVASADTEFCLKGFGGFIGGGGVTGGFFE